MGKLLPCPFCGGKAEAKWMSGPGWLVKCKKCSARTIGGINLGDDEIKAIEAWNRRDPHICPILSDNEVQQPCIEGPCPLDELRQMDGEPIWIKEFPPYAFAGYKVLSLRVVDVYGDIVCEDGDIYEYERYGETWLAYRSKPKEEQPCD